MHLTKNGVTIILEDAEIVRMALERLNGSAFPTDLRGIAVPRIGDHWHGQGGTYTGIAHGRDGAPDYHLIAGPEFDEDITWNDANDKAPQIEVEGHRDFALPFLDELSIARGNARKLFKDRAYWSCEQHADSSDYAWCQYFHHGYQSYYSKGSELRARLFPQIAFDHLTIHPFPIF